MAYQTTTTTSYGKRVGNSFKGIGTGILMFLAGTVCLWWNEGRTVKTAKDIQETEGKAIHVENVDKIDNNNNGAIIHAVAMTATDDILTDPDFAVSVNAVKLSRTVEYYQDVEHATEETKDKVGGSQETVTTYTYKTEWVSKPVTGAFADPNHPNKNFVYREYSTEREIAKNVTFGAYKLQDGLINSISGEQDVQLNLPAEQVRALNKLVEDRIRANNGYSSNYYDYNDVLDTTLASYKYVQQSGNVLYIGANPNSPSIGDVKITFTYVPAGKASVIAQINDNTLCTFTGSKGTNQAQLRMGEFSMEQMFTAAKESNNMMKWLLRALGVILVIVGLKGVFGPLVTILKVLPFLANIANVGVGIVCSLVGIVWSLLIIAIAWIVYRPVLGICLLAAAAAAIAFLVMKSKNAPATAPTPEPTPATTGTQE